MTTRSMEDDAEERAVTVDAVGRAMTSGNTEEEARAALVSLPGADNDTRARVARRVIGTRVSALRLAYLNERVRGEVPATAAEFLEAYIRFEEAGVPEPMEWPENTRERIVVERSCPRPLVDVLVNSLGAAGADAFLAASNVPGPKVLRANTLKTTRDALQRRLSVEGISTVPGRVSPFALIVQGRANLFGSQAWRDGWFEVQDEASQAAALACAVKAGDVVVDYCAGRGGKTLALAMEMENRGSLCIHDVDAGALRDMAPRLARAGVTNVVHVLPELGGADVVLVDAPCTSSGVLRRSPDLRYELGANADALTRTISGITKLQRSILLDAGRYLKPGGRLVYATCSVIADENRDVLSALDASLWTRVSERFYYPHVDGTDGFYVAVLVRA
jgi:16S rRNA (cytosine967-C5)-methyltransferase